MAQILRDATDCSQASESDHSASRYQIQFVNIDQLLVNNEGCVRYDESAS